MASSLPQKRKTKLKDIKALGQQLLSSKAHINNLPLLLRFISPEAPPHHLLESLLSLQSFFITLLPELPPSVVSSKRPRLEDSVKEDPDVIYQTWLRSKFDEFVKSMIEVLSCPDSEEALREVVLDALMEFVKLGNGGQFNSAIYHKLLHSIVYTAAPPDILSEVLASKYFKYIDVRYFTYISMEKFAKTFEADDGSDEKALSSNHETGNQQRESLEISIRKIHNIISQVPPLESSNDKSEVEMWSKSVLIAKVEENNHLVNGSTRNVLSAASIAKKMRLKFTKAWTTFLRLPLPVDLYKEVLANLHQDVIPHMSKPVILCDFLTRSYDIGGVVSVMALSSLFILMTEHGLEYPNFYEKLYALLVPTIFLAKHRARFFQLLDSCLKSPLLPAYLAAAFAKKLSRLALFVPPSGALIIIALIHNLLRRHPSINCLVHQEDGDENAESNTDDIVENKHKSATDGDDSSERPGVDRFNDEERNPIKSNAMRSSLWEIEAIRHHYCPPVSRFVSSLESDLTVRSKTTEVNVKDFSSGSYATIFGAEMRRRVKQVPLAFYKATPSCLFSESDFPGWTFKFEEGKGSNTKVLRHIIPDRPEMKDVSEKRQRIECS